MERVGRISKGLIRAALLLVVIMVMTGCDEKAQPKEIVQDNPFSADWWVENRCDDGTILTNEEILMLDKEIFETDGIGVARPDRLGALTLADIRSMIEDAGFPDKPFLNGVSVTEDDRKRIAANRNLEGFQKAGEADTASISYAIATKNCSVRTYPTAERLTGDEVRFDYLQETGLYLGDPMAVLWTSADGCFVYVRAANYRGWVSKDDIGFCDEAAFKAYCDFLFEGKQELSVSLTGEPLPAGLSPEKLPILTRGVFVRSLEVNLGKTSGTSESFDRYVRMGTVLPMDEKVYFPVRSEDGRCVFTASKVDGDDVCRIGELIFCTDNILTLAGRLLGTPYSWGDESERGMDCSSTVNSVFRCFGLFLARNTGDLKRMPLVKTDLSGLESEAKAQELSKLDTGSLLFMPGHVMMYLGESDGVQYILHNTTNVNTDTKTYEEFKCIITRVDTGKTGSTYLDRLDTAVSWKRV